MGTVAFQTDVGLEESEVGRVYKEWMVQCWANMTDDDVKIFYVSRAYKTGEVFVYFRSGHENVYNLQAWVKKVRVVHERDNPDGDQLKIHQVRL